MLGVVTLIAMAPYLIRPDRLGNRSEFPDAFLFFGWASGGAILLAAGVGILKRRKWAQVLTVVVGAGLAVQELATTATYDQWGDRVAIVALMVLPGAVLVCALLTARARANF